MANISNLLHIGVNIKTERLKQNLKQHQLANMANISVNTLSRYENGERIPSAEILNRIATALNIRADQLISATVDHQKDEEGHINVNTHKELCDWFDQQDKKSEWQKKRNRKKYIKVRRQLFIEYFDAYLNEKGKELPDYSQLKNPDNEDNND